MKNVLLPFLALLVFATTATAQDAEAAFKKAKKLYGNVATIGITDPEKAAADLAEARTNIDIAAATPDAVGEKNLYKLWEIKAAIYNDISKDYINKKVLDNNHQASVEGNPAIEAYKASKAGLALGELKKWQTKELLKYMLVTANYLSNYGGIYYGEQKYAEAFESFETSLEARNMLMDNSIKDYLPTDKEYHEQMFSVAVCAEAAGNDEGASKYFAELYKVSYPEPGVYKGMYRNLLKTDEDAALEVLNKGRELFPNNQPLLVDEINHYLRGGKLEQLIEKLKEGYKQDPSNLSFVTTLGQVYDQLGTKELEAGNAEKSAEYVELALNSYQQVIEKDPKNHDALYSIGAVYYNKAAILTKDLTELENDFSKAGTAKYNAKKEEITAMFDKALPYFQDAEKLSPGDMNTLIALKEVYARKNDLDTSNEFKQRIDMINNGETIEASYFDK